MQTASKNLMETLSDIYEKEWVGQDMLYVQAQNHEMLWADLAHKLSDQVVIPLNTYQAQFPEMRVSSEMLSSNSSGLTVSFMFSEKDR